MSRHYKEVAHARDVNAFRALGMLRSLRSGGYIPAALHQAADEIIANDAQLGRELDDAFAAERTAITTPGADA